VQDAPTTIIDSGKPSMRLSSLALVAATLVAGNAFAATSPATGSFKVTASVANSCIVTTTKDIAFGAYDPADTNFSSALDGAGSVSVRCTRGTAANVALEQGDNPTSGSTCAAPLRQMASGSDLLRYDIYSDSGRTTVWGCDPANRVSFTSLASNTAVTLPTYGRIPAGQDVPAGSYADKVVVTVTF
jgi:spore coat protein U-like protein